MLNILEITDTNYEKAIELGYIVDASRFESESDAEQEGFYWVDEFDKWVDIKETNKLIEK